MSGVSMAEAIQIIKDAYQADFGLAHGYYEDIELNRPRMKAFLEAAGVDVAALEAEAKGDAEDDPITDYEQPVVGQGEMGVAEVAAIEDRRLQLAIERFTGYCHQYNDELHEALDDEVLKIIPADEYNDLFYKLENTDSRDLINFELETFYGDWVESAVL